MQDRKMEDQKLWDWKLQDLENEGLNTNGWLSQKFKMHWGLLAGCDFKMHCTQALLTCNWHSIGYLDATSSVCYYYWMKID